MPWASEGRRPRVLIVEDDRMVLELVRTRLDLAGFQTFYARDGREGLIRIQDLEASRVFRRLLSVRRSYDDDKEQVFA